MNGQYFRARPELSQIHDTQPMLGQPGSWAPVKTSQGRAELTQPRRELTEHQHSVLRLVDGQRTASQIQSIAAQIGANPGSLDELFDLGLVALPEDPTVKPSGTAKRWPTPRRNIPTIALADFVPTNTEPLVAPVIHIDETLPVRGRAAVSSSVAGAVAPAAAVTRSPVDAEPTRPGSSAMFDDFARTNRFREEEEAPPSTLSPSRRSRGGRIDSMMSSLFPLIETALGALGRNTVLALSQDAALEESRRILMREVRAKAPVTGALTIVKLRRVATREELLLLLDEVNVHIDVPMRRLSTLQTMLHVRELLQRPM